MSGRIPIRRRRERGAFIERPRGARKGWNWRRGASSRLIELAPGAPALHAAEAGATAAPVVASPLSSLAALLAMHILRDGEIVLLILRPSIWFIVFNSAFVSVIAGLISIALAIADTRSHDHVYYELGLFVIAGRLMWSTLQWMGRLYILTDLRVLRINGIFNIEVQDCPLRKVVRTRMVSPPQEKAVGVGTIEIIPRDESIPVGLWQTVSKPKFVHAQLIAAIKRANQSGMPCD